MFPVLPSRLDPQLEQLAVDVMTGAAALGKGLHPAVLEETSRFMAQVNSYYTNAMEGNPSKLRDIEAALSNRLSRAEADRNFQLEHVAHIQVQDEMVRRLRAEPSLNVCSREFLQWIHARFYSKLPPAMRAAKTDAGKTVPVEPGALRERGAMVGRHQPPETLEEVLSRLKDFEALLNPAALTGARKAVGMASSHHRLLWIHPFPDGNGRVTRLFTVAYGLRIGLEDPPLWTVTRAFARRRADYDAHLAMADLPRRNDLDGRGPLSEESLTAFCRFFLECCKDQIQYMAGLMDLNGLGRRYERCLKGLVEERRLSKSGLKVMENLLLLGKVPRAQVPGLCGVKQRRASQVIRELFDQRLVRSASAYGDLTLHLSSDMASALFPALT